MRFELDRETGSYFATMSSSATRPFTGDVVVNVNLFNADTKTLFTSSHFLFVDAPAQAVSVSGTDTQLRTWEAGDRIAACQGPGGIIPESCQGGLDAPTDFSSGVINFSPASTQVARDHFQSAPPAALARLRPNVVPPPTGLITSPEFRNFRFWVRIGGSRMGTRVAGCLPETVCVAGSVPTRVEVLIRITGPKSNGYLWPAIVKFNTTKTEVWIEQVSTRAVKYYSFPALAPDASELPGALDRTGFLP